MLIIETTDEGLALTMERVRDHALKVEIVDTRTKMALSCEVMSPRWESIRSYLDTVRVLSGSKMDDMVFQYNQFTLEQRETFKQRIQFNDQVLTTHGGGSQRDSFTEVSFVQEETKRKE